MSVFERLDKWLYKRKVRRINAKFRRHLRRKGKQMAWLKELQGEE